MRLPTLFLSARMGSRVGCVVIALVLAACSGSDAPESDTPPASNEVQSSRVQMALTLLRQGHVDEGLEQLRFMEWEEKRRDPHPPWLNDVSTQLVRRRRLYSADSLLTLYPEAVRDDPELSYLSANLAGQLGRLDEAMRKYDALEGPERLLQAARYEQARLLLDAERFAESISLARQALERDPRHESARMVLVEALIGDSQAEEALRETRKLPDLLTRRKFLGQSYLAMDRPDSARAPLQQALLTRPDFDEARLLLGRAELLLGDADAAAKLLEPLSAAEPPFEDAQFYLSAALRQLGEVARADSVAEAFQRGQRFDRAVLLRQRGLEASEGGELDRALGLFVEARDLAPEVPVLWNDVGAVLAKLKRYEEAEEAFLRGAELFPRNPVVWRNLANLYQITDEDERRDAALARLEALNGGADASPETN